MGKVAGIYIAESRGAPVTAVQEVHAVPQQGLEGDRHFKDEPTRSRREITLIEIEAIDALRRDYDITIPPGDARRQIVTRGVALNHLVAKRFRVGEVECLGTMLCDPCTHVEELTVKGLQEGLTHRGGLCAQILTEGTIRLGDEIEVDLEPSFA